MNHRPLGYELRLPDERIHLKSSGNSRLPYPAKFIFWTRGFQNNFLFVGIPLYNLLQKRSSIKNNTSSSELGKTFIKLLFDNMPWPV